MDYNLKYIFYSIIILGLYSCQENMSKEKSVNPKSLMNDSLSANQRDSNSDTNINDEQTNLNLILFLSDNNKYGFKDELDSVIIQPKYSLAANFSVKLAPVLEGNHWKIINKKGETVLELKELKPIVWINELSGEKYVEPISERKLPIEFKDGKKGFLNMATGKVSPKYDDVMSFSQNRAFVLVNNLWGIIGPGYKMILKPQFDHAKPFSDDRAVVGKNDKMGVIDLNFNSIIDFKYEHIHQFSEGLSFVTDNDSYMNYWLVDVNGKTIHKGPFEQVFGSFKNGECEVFKNGKCIIINRNGEKIRNEKDGCPEGC